MSSNEEEGPLQYEVNQSDFGGLISSLKEAISCKSDHSKFVPVTDFKLDDLPEDIRCNNILKLINLNIDLAVMVSVESLRTSNDVANIKGTNMQGSGSICYFSDTHDLFPCNHIDVDKCQMCHIPNCPYKDTFGENHFVVTSCRSALSEDQLEKAHLAFRVSTNQHVVRDEEDAKNTTVQLFYHSEDKKDTLIARVATVCEKWAEQDKVHLVCVMDMNARVKNLLECMRHNIRSLFETISPALKKNFIDNYVIVVSHPHGTQKVVSVGRKIKCEQKEIKNDMWIMETKYQVQTCTGCSGAPVIGPGWVDGGPGYRVHCGYVVLRESKQKVCVSKSHWVVGSDARGGALPAKNEPRKDKFELLSSVSSKLCS